MISPRTIKKRTLLAWAILMAMAMPAIAADRDPFPADQPPPPPEPNPLQVEVPRGGPVLITLSAYSLTSSIIRFRIRRTARAGQLGIPRMVTAGTAVVRYKPPAGSGPGEDDFYYAVQSAAGVSAPAEVRIKITDKDPILVAPTDIEFGQILPGQSARRPLVLENIGGGLAEGTLEIPDGWTIEGDPSYSVAAGAKQSFTLIFKPSEEKIYTGDVTYSGDPGRASDLNGEGVPPIAITSGTVELNRAGGVRMGAIHLENRTGGVRTLKVTAGPDLRTEATVEVPAKGSADLVVQAVGDGEIDDEVAITGDGVKAEVPVHAAVLRPANAVAGSPVDMPSASTNGRTTANQIQASNEPAGPAPAESYLTAAADDQTLPPLTLPSMPDQAGLQETDGRMSVWPLGIGDVGAHEARVACNFKGGSASSYRVEAESVGVDAQGRPVAIWTPMANTTVAPHGTIVVADLQGLRPRTQYAVRLAGLDAQGEVIESSSVGDIWTAGEAKGGAWKWIILAAIAAAGPAVWRWRNRRI